jgi:predicted Zn-dependent protease
VLAARVGLLLLSLVAIAWLASAYPGARDEARAAALPTAADGRLAPADARRAQALYASAMRRRPDTTAVPRLAALELVAGESDWAIHRLRRLLAGEPENVSAWTVLALALAESDPEAARLAGERRTELAPPVPR